MKNFKHFLLVFAVIFFSIAGYSSSNAFENIYSPVTMYVETSTEQIEIKSDEELYNISVEIENLSKDTKEEFLFKEAPFIISNLDSNNFYKITVKSEFGDVISQLKAKTGDYIPQPLYVEANKHGDEIIVKWEAIPNVSVYQLLYLSSTSYELIDLGIYGRNYAVLDDYNVKVDDKFIVNSINLKDINIDEDIFLVEDDILDDVDDILDDVDDIDEDYEVYDADLKTFGCGKRFRIIDDCVSVSKTYKGASISWNPVFHAAKYEIYVSNNRYNGEKYVKTIHGTSAYLSAEELDGKSYIFIKPVIEKHRSTFYGRTCVIYIVLPKPPTPPTPPTPAPECKDCAPDWDIYGGYRTIYGMIRNYSTKFSSATITCTGQATNIKYSGKINSDGRIVFSDGIDGNQHYECDLRWRTSDGHTKSRLRTVYVQDDTEEDRISVAIFGESNVEIRWNKTANDRMYLISVVNDSSGEYVVNGDILTDNVFSTNILSCGIIYRIEITRLLKGNAAPKELPREYFSIDCATKKVLKHKKR